MTWWDTKRRRAGLEAAGEEFADKGFELARVRAICDRAEANLAAVNYHFGDKEQLYVAALREAHRCGLDPELANVPSGLSAAERLRMFIHHFLGRVLAMNSPDDWQHRLMLREMLSPTPFSDVLVSEVIRPRFELVKGLMREICPEADDRASALWSSASSANACITRWRGGSPSD